MIGFSLGSSYGTQYLAQFPNNKIKGMVSISNPFDVFRAA